MVDLVEQLSGCGITVERNKPLSELTTLRIGGPARYVLTVTNRTQLQVGLESLARAGERVYVLGRGSNVLASDSGFAGAVVRLCGEFEEYAVRGDRIVAGGGASLRRVVDVAVDRSLAGLEALTGIPGTIGGALAMNAGAHGVWISHVVEQVTVLRVGDPSTGCTEVSPGELAFGYRTSCLSGSVVVSAVFRLTAGDSYGLRARQAELLRRRAETQPLETRNAGCVFKNPPCGVPAGYLIEQAGLKGFRMGPVRISERHANFVINEGGATAAEYLRMVRYIIEVVRERCGVTLEPELRFLGEF